MRYKTQHQKGIIYAFISAMSFWLFLAGCSSSANNEIFSPSLLAEWDVGNEYYVTWNTNSKLFLVYSHLNKSELNNVQAFDVESFERIWVAKNKFPTESVFTKDGLQIVEIDAVDNAIRTRDARQGNVIQEQIGNCDIGQFILPSSDDKAFLMANVTETVGLNVTPNFFR